MTTRTIREALNQTECDRCKRSIAGWPGPGWSRITITRQGLAEWPQPDFCPDCTEYLRAKMDDYDGAPVDGGVSDPAETSGPRGV